MHGDKYQLQPLHSGLVLQVLPEVEAFHELVDETERVCFRRVHPHEWCYAYISVVKNAAHANFIVKPLREMSAVYSVQAHTIVTTYLNDLRDVERYVGTIRL